MQALFSSFYVNLNILVENLKTAENGGFKPFLGIISCVPFLQIGEIPIFPLYIVACFWMFCYQLPEYLQTFVQLLEKGPFSLGGLWRSCPIFHISTFLRPPFFQFFPLEPKLEHLLPQGSSLYSLSTFLQERPWELSPKASTRHLPHRTPPSSPTASVDRQRPCSSQ